ncbi:MAG: C40 family peptidase [Stomatobaculum sp.]|nr:C40 family peptidase [Stomatobaculum sp.]
MRKIKEWFAAFGLAALVAAGTAGQAYAAPAETAIEAVQTEEETTEAAAEENTENAEASDSSLDEEAAAAAEDQAAEEQAAAEGETAASGEETAAAEEETEEEETQLRENVVDYALSFVGGRYVWGGNDPHTGADCSGFVRYILSNTAGVNMSRTSADQAREGVTVSAEEMQPGDLLFYGKGSRVNHVAMYIGDGQIVHASTAKTGIKVSQWNYRNPIRIASFIG